MQTHHFHSILPDGLFAPGAAGELTFTPLPAPTTSEVEELTLRIARRLTDLLVQVQEEGSEPPMLEPDQAALYEALQVAVHAPLASRASVLSGTEFSDGGEEGGFSGKPLCAQVAGFSLHTAQAVSAKDRAGLETLCRYDLRPAFSQRRLSLAVDGRVVYQLRRPWPNERGATHLLLAPRDFLRRLAALVPAPYVHQARTFGCFANHSGDRKHLPRPPRPVGSEGSAESVKGGAEASAPEEQKVAALPAADSTPSRRSRVPWAQLLQRVAESSHGGLSFSH